MSEHRKDCNCFFCRNPKVSKYLFNLTKKINKEGHDERLLIIKNMIKGLMGTTELSLVNRLGVLNIIQFEFLAESKMMALLGQMEEEETKGKVDYIA